MRFALFVIVSVCLLAVGAMATRTAVLERFKTSAALQADSKEQFEIETFFKGYPVHESITYLAIKQSKYSGQASHMEDFVHGALWNDDPERTLFWTDKTYGNVGVQFAQVFCSCKKVLFKAPAGTTFGPTARHTCRSHFGDLSFIHAQEPFDGITASCTVWKILNWFKLMHAWHIGTIAPTTKMKDIDAAVYPAAKLLFPGSTKNAFEIFSVPASDPDRFKRFVVGSMLHTIQDSFSQAHANRYPKWKSSEADNDQIQYFTSYGQQDEDKHGAQDTTQSTRIKVGKWLDNINSLMPGAVMNEIFKQVFKDEVAQDLVNTAKRANRALIASKKFLDRLADCKTAADWGKAGGLKAILETDIFKLRTGHRTSFAGEVGGDPSKGLAMSGPAKLGTVCSAVSSDQKFTTETIPPCCENGKNKSPCW